MPEVLMQTLPYLMVFLGCFIIMMGIAYIAVEEFELRSVILAATFALILTVVITSMFLII